MPNGENAIATFRYGDSNQQSIPSWRARRFFNWEFSEIVEEEVNQTEESTILEGCGELEITKGIETPHKEEFPQERSYTEEAETVENEEVMIDKDTHSLLCHCLSFMFALSQYDLKQSSTQWSTRIL